MMMIMDEDSFGGNNGNDKGNNNNRTGIVSTTPTEVSKNQVSAHARPLYELECLVNALDCLETTALISAMMANTHTQYVLPCLCFVFHSRLYKFSH